MNSAPGDSTPAAEFEGASPPFVLLHGFSGSGADFESFAARLGHAALAPDLPGHGSAPSSAEAHACTLERAVADVLPALGRWGLLRPILLGYSLGGRVALHLARRAPRRFAGVVLIGASPGLPTAEQRAARRREDAALAARLETLSAAAFLAEWEARPIIASQARIPPGVRAQMRARRLAADPRGWADSLRGLGTGSLPSLWEELDQVALPTLLLTGAADAKFEEIAARMQAALPDAVHVTIAGAGHCAHLEQPGRTAKAITAWLTARSLH